MAQPIILPINANIDRLRDDVDAGFGIHFSEFSPYIRELGQGINSGTYFDCRSLHNALRESRNKPPAKNIILVS